VKITGFGFFDSAHWTHAKPKVGHNRGSRKVKTLWEIHAVVKLEMM